MWSLTDHTSDNLTCNLKGFLATGFHPCHYHSVSLNKLWSKWTDSLLTPDFPSINAAVKQQKCINVEVKSQFGESKQ